MPYRDPTLTISAFDCRTVRFVNVYSSWDILDSVPNFLKKKFFFREVSKSLKRNPRYLKNYKCHQNVPYGDRSQRLSAMDRGTALFNCTFTFWVIAILLFVRLLWTHHVYGTIPYHIVHATFCTDSFQTDNIISFEKEFDKNWLMVELQRGRWAL